MEVLLLRTSNSLFRMAPDAPVSVFVIRKVFVEIHQFRQDRQRQAYRSNQQQVW